jgi:hypothetical protein
MSRKAVERYTHAVCFQRHLVVGREGIPRFEHCWKSSVLAIRINEEQRLPLCLEHAQQTLSDLEEVLAEIRSGHESQEDRPGRTHS